jgi:hypothetical protein
MKRFFIPLLIVLNLFATQVTFAGGPLGGSTEITQYLNFGELLTTSGASMGTAISTALSAGIDTIGDPLANSLISMAAQEASSDVLAWAKNGFNGNPLVLGNPQKYAANQGLKRVNTTLGLIPENTTYGDSVFNAVLSANKETSAASKLNAVSQSDIPRMLQKNVCKADMLLSIAEKDTLNGDGTINYDAAKQRMLQLNNELCAVSATDKTVAAKLQRAAQIYPEIGGWDSWLAVTSGDNEQNRIRQGQQIAAQEKAKAEESVKADLRGENVLSDKVCPLDGEDGECTIMTPSSIAKDIIAKAENSGQDRLSGANGIGGLVSSLIGAAFNSITKGIANSVFDNGGAKQTNTTVTLKAARPPTNDLASDPGAKAERTNPIRSMLKNYSNDLSDLRNTDNMFLSGTSAYESRIEGLKACYDSLGNDYPAARGDQQFIDAMNFYNDRRAKINNRRASLNEELSNISKAEALVSQTQSKLNAVMSSEEISVIFRDYNSQLEQGGYPKDSTPIIRNGEYQKAQNEANRDSDLDTHNGRCGSLRTQYTPN